MIYAILGYYMLLSLSLEAASQDKKQKNYSLFTFFNKKFSGKKKQSPEEKQQAFVNQLFARCETLPDSAQVILFNFMYADISRLIPHHMWKACTKRFFHKSVSLEEFDFLASQVTCGLDNMGSIYTYDPNAPVASYGPNYWAVKPTKGEKTILCIHPHKDVYALGTTFPHKTTFCNQFNRHRLLINQEAYIEEPETTSPKSTEKTNNPKQPDTSNSEKSKTVDNHERKITEEQGILRNRISCVNPFDFETEHLTGDVPDVVVATGVIPNETSSHNMYFVQHINEKLYFQWCDEGSTPVQLDVSPKEAAYKEIASTQTFGHTIEEERHVHRLTGISPDGNLLLLTLYTDPSVGVFDTLTGKKITRLRLNDVTPNGRLECTHIIWPYQAIAIHQYPSQGKTQYDLLLRTDFPAKIIYRWSIDKKRLVGITTLPHPFPSISGFGLKPRQDQVLGRYTFGSNFGEWFSGIYCADVGKPEFIPVASFSETRNILSVFSSENGQYVAWRVVERLSKKSKYYRKEKRYGHFIEHFYRFSGPLACIKGQEFSYEKHLPVDLADPSTKNDVPSFLRRMCFLHLLCTADAERGPHTAIVLEPKGQALFDSLSLSMRKSLCTHIKKLRIIESQ